MSERIRKSRSNQSSKEEMTVDADLPNEPADLSESDALLAEIDELLSEVNAAEFVREFVQKGGE